MSEYDIRRKAYAAGAEAATRDEQKRIAAMLEDIVGSDDVDGKLLALLSELQGNDRSASAATPPAASPAARGELKRFQAALASIPTTNRTESDALDAALLESVIAGTADAPDRMAAALVLGERGF